MDLFSRTGKHGNFAATFAIRFPKLNSEKKLAQLPYLGLVCNFDQLVAGEPPLLSHNQAETLFHEFGHCLSGVLSRTEYQHVAGNNWGKLGEIGELNLGNNENLNKINLNENLKMKNNEG
jgi:Zn-dependent oligopeptidase